MGGYVTGWGTGSVILEEDMRTMLLKVIAQWREALDNAEKLVREHP